MVKDRYSETYKKIIRALTDGRLTEPFTKGDIKKSTNISGNTVNTFIHKHNDRGPGSTLFIRVKQKKPKEYKLSYPVKWEKCYKR